MRMEFKVRNRQKEREDPAERYKKMLNQKHFSEIVDGFLLLIF